MGTLPYICINDYDILVSTFREETLPIMDTSALSREWKFWGQWLNLTILEISLSNALFLFLFLLFREYAATKKCFQSLMDSECRFSETQTQIMKYETSDINPFCENMRDPGSSGSELCAGYFSSIASTSFEYYASAHWLPTLVISFTLNNMLM